MATIVSLVDWRGAIDANNAIEALDQGRDIAVDTNARSETLLARIAFLAKRGEIDRARALVEALDRSANVDMRARGHYLLANALLRKAFGLIERSEVDAANPFVNLAKREYRRALQLAPDYWDAKYNLDVAARLVRDFPDYERKSGDELSADPKKLWTDIPGKPKGLP
ncbi:MxaK protein [Methylocystis sp.]|uniref:MxaK protein n=1 Tax=Methylocystis sp. TaxID=1911079 RepID=UPI003D12B00A